MGLASALGALLGAYCRLVQRRPRLLLFLYTLLTVCVIALLWRPLEVESDFSSFIRADGPAMRQRDAFMLALGEKEGPSGRRLQAARLPPGGAAAWQGRRLRAESSVVVSFELTLIYEASGGDVFDERALREVRDLEASLRELPGWRELCNERVLPVARHLCDPGSSLAAYAWPSQEAPRQAGNGRLFAMHFDALGSEPLPVPAMLAYLQQGEHEKHNLERFFPADFEPPALGDAPTDHAEARLAGPRLLRTHYDFCLDITEVAASGSTAALNSELDRARRDYRRFVTDAVYPLLLQARAELQHVRVHYYGAVITGLEVDETLQGDLKWAVGAALFIAICLWVHMRSLFLSGMSLVLVFLAVPVAYVLTPAAKTTLASFLSLFLIAGIGSDVVFIFFDFWSQSTAHCHDRDLDRRLAWTLSHAAINCLASAATTAASFLANLASVLQPLREFGLFMGLCVMSSFVLMLLFLPPVFVVHAQRRQLRLQRQRAKRVPALQDATALSSIVPMPEPSGSAGSAGSAAEVEEPPAGSAARPPRKSCASVSLRCLVRCIEACPAALLALSLLCVLAAAVAVGLRAELGRGQPEVFPEGHNHFEVQRLQDRFTTVPRLSLGAGAPRSTGAACAANASQNLSAIAASVEVPCSLHWCHAAPQPPPAGGTCWRSPARGAHGSAWGTNSCSTLRVRMRAAAQARPEGGWQRAALALLPRVGAGHHPSVLRPERQLAPLVLEEWASGQVSMSPFFDMGSVDAVRPLADAQSQQHCEVEVLCFLGPRACSLPGWRELGPPALPSPAQGASPRSLFAPAATGTVPRHKRLDVAVVWGLGAARATPLVGAVEEPWRFDPGFDLRDPWAQRAIHAFCTNQPTGLSILREGSSCWIDNFRHMLLTRGQRFPSRDFDRQALQFYSNTVVAGEHLWYVDGRVVAAKLVFAVDVSRDAGSRELLSYKELWDAYVNERNSEASCTANRAWHTAHSWVSAEAEVAVVDSTVATILISASCGFLGMLVFTADPVLSCMVLAIVLGVICGIAFFIVVIMGWNLGPVEVISLVVFVGYSVTYSLHIAHFYGKTGPECLEEPTPASEAKACDACGGAGCTYCHGHGRDQGYRQALPEPSAAELRRGRTRAAVLHVGGATLSSAASTAGSSVFLLFCTLRIFTKLGSVVIAVALLSCALAMVPLPAALLLLGPGPGRWHERCLRCLAARRRPRGGAAALLR